MKTDSDSRIESNTDPPLQSTSRRPPLLSCTRLAGVSNRPSNHPLNGWRKFYRQPIGARLPKGGSLSNQSAINLRCSQKVCEDINPLLGISLLIFGHDSSETVPI